MEKREREEGMCIYRGGRMRRWDESKKEKEKGEALYPTRPTDCD